MAFMVDSTTNTALAVITFTFFIVSFASNFVVQRYCKPTNTTIPKNNEIVLTLLHNSRGMINFAPSKYNYK
jgi:hypothetical protein